MIRPHAFVVMPFGERLGLDGELIQFDRIYAEFIAPALDAAGLEPFRSDEELRAGGIRADMFQELLLADLVIVDLTIDNPNVWYELGVRHALRARGVVLISGGRIPSAFDVYTDRKLPYTLAAGGPAPKETLAKETALLAAIITKTMESWHGHKVSPVYALLPNLQEPDWKSLRAGGVREIWEQHDDWMRRLELARKAGTIGDVLVLADEGPVAPFRAEAWATSGSALRRAERFRFALTYLDKALAIEPKNLTALREKGMCLQRLGMDGKDGHSTEHARAHYRSMLKDFPTDTETWSLMGRVEKDAWTSIWRRGDTPEQMRADAAFEDALLRAAIEAYEQAYRTNPAHYYSGVNALTLMHLARHLNPGETRYDETIKVMAGAVRFAAQCERDPDQQFWAKATLADVEVLDGTPETVTSRYKDALAKNRRDWFALNSCRSQLLLLRDLGFRPEVVAEGIALFDRALAPLRKPEGGSEPRTVLLFSGHMIDAPGRPKPRFPAHKERAAADRIALVLDQIGAGPADVAFSQAAAGGDLLFVEACIARKVRTRVYLPFSEAEFIQRSIEPSEGGRLWRDRFYAMKDRLERPIRIMPAELGPAPKHVNPFERCNLWLFYSALACGVDRVRFITLWDGGGSDGPGGTAHMVEAVRKETGHVTCIDPREL